MVVLVILGEVGISGEYPQEHLPFDGHTQVGTSGEYPQEYLPFDGHARVGYWSI